METALAINEVLAVKADNSDLVLKPDLRDVFRGLAVGGAM